MVAAVRQGQPMRQVARLLGVSLSTVQRWVGRAQGQRLDRFDGTDRPSGPSRSPRRTAAALEQRVLTLRHHLRYESALGDYGAATIRAALWQEAAPQVPSVRTIGRILERCGALDGRHRQRRPAPPPGWYLPDLAAGQAELDSFDIVEGLALRGGLQLQVLNVKSLHGRWCGCWPQACITAQSAVECLQSHWRLWGLPTYAQFDNDTIFQGPHHHPDCFGRVIRLCLSLRVVPVFAPPRETGFQAMIENFNGRWQNKVFQRFEHVSLADLCQHSDAFVEADRRRQSSYRDSAPPRRAFPRRWQLDLQRPLRGRVIFLRRTDASGQLRLLGHTFPVGSVWPHRLVRAEVDLSANKLRFMALRRRTPHEQPLLAECDYQPPQRAFRQ